MLKDALKAKAIREEMRSLSLEGSILILCEHGTYDYLRPGFVYAAHTVLERQGSDNFICRKNREDDIVLERPKSCVPIGTSDGHTLFSAFSEVIDHIASVYTNCIFVLPSVDPKLPIEIERFLVKDFPESKISRWYSDSRGKLLGRKFGI